MAHEYVRSEITACLEKHFKARGYDVQAYSDEYLPVRVPLYCRKDNNGIPDDIVIDLTTSKLLLKGDWFHHEGVGPNDMSSLEFYQHYFIQSRIYLAYADYVQGDAQFQRFETVCKSKGIGLLKISLSPKRTVQETLPAYPLFHNICDDLEINNDDIRDKLEYHLRNCLHYFVYYPKPEFKKRAITGNLKEAIPFAFIDRLCELRHVFFKAVLVKLSSGYRETSKDDYHIASETIDKLWKQVVKIAYPTSHIPYEEVLLLNERYRDHFLHQFQVFLLGIYIIDVLYDNDQTFMGNLNKQRKIRLEKEWLFVATYHDFNYSIQEFDQWTNKFFGSALNIPLDPLHKLSSINLDAAFIREGLSLKTRVICEELALPMDATVTNFLFEQVTTKKNHGLLSALSLLKLFEEEKKTFPLSRVAAAIALHDEDIWSAFSGKERIKDNKKRKPKDAKRNWYDDFRNRKQMENLEFSKHPLAFLLIFCDTVEDWGRAGKYQEAQIRLDGIFISNSPFEIVIRISFKDTTKCKYGKNKIDEIRRVASFLKDPRFVIELRNRAKRTNAVYRIPMKGS